MWNDEDNNPYGSSSFDGRDTFGSPTAASPDTHPYDTEAPVYTLRGSDADTDEDDEDDDNDEEEEEEEEAHGEAPAAASTTTVSHDELQPRRKPGGYDSRIEQLLYENPETPIYITDAGKSVENSGRYIVYTIRTGDLEVRRRYSEFASLREALTRLHPTLIIPPIPEKHTVADYAANPTNAKQDQQIIDLRKRMLAVFLNRCRRMEQIRTDGVWWRFLDPNASWSEMLHSHPISSIPKLILKAPPLDTPNPTAAHSYLPIPAGSAKLRVSSGPASAPIVEGSGSGGGSGARFPPESSQLSEQELDPYFTLFEASIKELEQLLMGPMEKVNRRTLSHLSALASDQCELGARYNAFALSETAPTLGSAIERVGQAVDSSYIATEELSSSLGASFAEPMRENAQFAGVVRSVLRYRILKRVQQEMTNDDLYKKRMLLDQLERSEAEARRIDQYLSGSQQLPPRRSASTRDSGHGGHGGHGGHRRDGSQEDTASIDSDFPPTHGGDYSSVPSAKNGPPERSLPQGPGGGSGSGTGIGGSGSGGSGHRKVASGNSITGRIFGPIRHAVQGVVDVDPERTRRDTITKTRESIAHLEQAQVASAQDVQDASASVLRDLKRFQREKEDDLKRYMIAYAKSQIEWAKKNRETWEEARTEVDKIDEA